MYFPGSVQEAVASAARDRKVILVLLIDAAQGGPALQDSPLEQAMQRLHSTRTPSLCNSVILRLEDDLADTDIDHFVDGKHFRALCPVQALPALVALTPLGEVLLKEEGVMESRIAVTLDLVNRAYVAYYEARYFAAESMPQGDDQPPAAAGTPARPAAAPAAGPVVLAPSVEAHPAESAVIAPAPGGEVAADGQNMAAAAAGVDAGAGGSSSPAVEGGAAVEEGPAMAAAPLAAVVLLRVKLPDGRLIQEEFQPTTRLQAVFAAVDAARAGQGGSRVPYVLVTRPEPGTASHGTAAWGPDQETATLSELGVQPDRLLLVVPHPRGHQPPMPSRESPAPASPAQPQNLVQERDEEEAEAIPRFSQQTEQQGVKLGDDAAQQAQQHFKQQTAVIAAAAPAPEADGGVSATEEDTVPPARAPPALPASKEVALDHATYQLQLRLPGGGPPLVGEFDPDATLAEVCHFVDMERTDGSGAPFCLVNAYPKKRFVEADMPLTLRVLGLGPRAGLLVEPLNDVPGRGMLRGAWGAVSGVVLRALGWGEAPLTVGGVPAATAADGGTASGLEEAEPPPPSNPAVHLHLGRGGQGSRAGVKRKSNAGGGAGGVHSLADFAHEGQGGNDEGNKYWNGNSTQFDGGDGKDD